MEMLFSPLSLRAPPGGREGGRGFPRLYAAASLKRVSPSTRFPVAASFSAALCRGLIEAAPIHRMDSARIRRFPRLYAAASLKHLYLPFDSSRDIRFPRLYAAASLKPILGRHLGNRLPPFSAALCRGLIEAAGRGRGPARGCAGFPRLYAAASLKPVDSLRFLDILTKRFPRLYAAASLKLMNVIRGAFDQRNVFRGFMPRPH